MFLCRILPRLAELMDGPQGSAGAEGAIVWNSGNLLEPSIELREGEHVRAIQHAAAEARRLVAVVYRCAIDRAVELEARSDVGAVEQARTILEVVLKDGAAIAPRAGAGSHSGTGVAWRDSVRWWCCAWRRPHRSSTVRRPDCWRRRSRGGRAARSRPGRSRRGSPRC